MKTRIVELRSDTFTLPTQEMKLAMLNASVGDDVYGEDPTVNELETLSAAMFEKEDAVFMPSGTMSNVASIMAHCWTRGQEIFIGDQSHISLNEQGGYAQLGAVSVRYLANNDDGTFSLDELQKKIDKGVHAWKSRSSLVCVENTHNWCHGFPLQVDFMSKLGQIAKANQMMVHCDGARIFNAAVKLDLPVSVLTKDCDSVAFCLSKGLCCPVGSLVVGSKEFVNRARRCRKALGGGMRQVGYLAAPGIVALKETINRLKEDHQHAYELATAISCCKSNAVMVDLDKVSTNIVFLRTDPKRVTGFQFVELMKSF